MEMIFWSHVVRFPPPTVGVWDVIYTRGRTPSRGEMSARLSVAPQQIIITTPKTASALEVD